MERTEAEKHFDKLLEARRQIGRNTYGHGLQHDDIYCWDQMALEEALDLAQYLATRNLQLLYEMQDLGQKANSSRESVRKVAEWTREAIVKELERLSYFECARVVRDTELPNV